MYISRRDLESALVDRVTGRSEQTPRVGVRPCTGLSIVDLVCFRRRNKNAHNLSIERVDMNCDRRPQRGDEASGLFHIHHQIARKCHSPTTLHVLHQLKR